MASSHKYSSRLGIPNSSAKDDAVPGAVRANVVGTESKLCYHRQSCIKMREEDTGSMRAIEGHIPVYQWQAQHANHPFDCSYASSPSA
jgi:hypothetical protein